MKLVCVNTSSELITAFQVMKYYYPFDIFDLVILDTELLDIDALTLNVKHRPNLRQVYSLHSYQRIPDGVRYSYYDAVLLNPTLTFRTAQHLLDVLSWVNPNIQFLGFEGNISLYDSYFPLCHKLYLYSQNLLSRKPKNVYGIPTMLDKDFMVMCSYIFGYTPTNSYGLQGEGFTPSYGEHKLLMFVPEGASRELSVSLQQLIRLYTTSLTVFVPFGTKEHGFFGEGLNIFRQQYPLELLAMQGLLSDALVVVPDSKRLSNLQLLQSLGIKAMVVYNQEGFLETRHGSQLSKLLDEGSSVKLVSTKELDLVLNQKYGH